MMSKTILPPTLSAAAIRRSCRIGTLGLMLGVGFLHGTAMADQVRVFDEGPTYEQLRQILIPQSTGGAARRIEIPRRDVLDGPSQVQTIGAPQMQPPAVPAPAPSWTPALMTPPASSAMPVPQARPEPRPAPPAPSLASPSPSQLAPAAPPQDEAGSGMFGVRINFALNSAVLPSASIRFVDALASLLKQEPSLALVIEGHTDARGSDEYNLQLSELRAEAVGLELVRRGVPAERLSVQGKGKTEPLLADAYDPQNRRVQFVRADLQVKR